MATGSSNTIKDHPVVSREEWLSARTALLVKEKEFTNFEAYGKRMGWNFKWVSSHETDFNFDYHVSFTPEQVARKEALYNFAMQDPHGSEQQGISVFYKDAAGRVFHTYSTHARGIDLMNTAYNYLDLTPKGRDEGGRDQYWVRRHDEYGG